MLTLSKYIEDNEVPFFNSIDYVPFNDSNFVDMLNEWCNFNHGSLQIRPLIEDALKTDADVIRKRVTNLINVRKYKYTKLYDTTLLEYNPIENYSMSESGTDIHTPNLTTTDRTNIGEQANSTTSTDSVSPYDTQTFTDSNKTIVSENNGAREDSNTKTETGTETTMHDFKRSGNIGVTTSQQMIESERKVVNFTFLKIVFANIIDDTCILTEWGDINEA